MIRGAIGLGLGATLAALSWIGGGVPGWAQEEEPLEAGVTTTTSPSSAVRIEERSFKRSLDEVIPPVAEIFADSAETVEQALLLSDQLDGIGVGKNSQIATVLCTIETLEVSPRQETLNFINYHLTKVSQLLTLFQDLQAPQIVTALEESASADPDAVYLYIHAAMQARGCVPEDFITVVVEAEETRVETVDTIRE